MAASIEELKIKITADQKDLARELKKANASTKSFSKKAANDMDGFGKSVKSVKSLIGSAAIAGTFVAGIALASNKLIKMGEAAIIAGDQIGKVASKLGITAEELQEYQIIAEAAGVSTETFNMAFQRFTRRLGEAKDGTGVLLGALKELDVSMYNVDGTARTTTEVFDEYGKKVGALTDNNKALSLTNKALDAEGVKMINMWRMAAEEQQRVVDVAKSYGAVISNDVIASMEEYATELGLINKGTEALGVQTDAVLAPVTIGWAKVKNEIAFTSLEFAKFLGLVDNNTVLAQKKVSDLEAKLSDLKEKAKTGKGSFLSTMFGGNPSGEISNVMTELREAKKELADLKAKKVKPDPVDPITTPTTPPAGAKGNDKQVLSYYETLRQAANDASMEITNAWDAQSRLDEEFQNGTISGEQYVFMQEKLNSLLLSNVEATEELAVATEETVQRSKTASEQLAESWMNQTDQMDNAFVSSMENSADALTDFVMTGKASFNDLANSIIKDLIRIQIQQMIVGFIGGAVSNISTASQFGTNVGSQQTSMIAAQNRGFAGGGTVQPGQVYPVGERGPEVFVPSSTGKIVNNSDSKNLYSNSGSIPVSVSIKNEGTAQSPTNATAAMSADGLVVSVVMNDLRRDGPISQGMQKTFRVKR